MSTYNGERFVVEQLQSILMQLPAKGRVLVRDDGSRDNTVAVITSLDDARISLTCGVNLGFGRSFLTLLAAAPPEADMVMFADQDDVWLPSKIKRAWQWLQAQGQQPALYASTQMLTDVKLRPLHVTRSWAQAPSFAGALAENMVTGCTAAMNAPARHLLLRAGVPEGVHFHDWWLYLVVSAFGQVHFDKQPTLLYRQHGANQIGHGAGWLGRNWQMMRFLARNDWVGILLGQAHALWRHYGRELGVSERRLLLGHIHFSPDAATPRWRMVFGLRRWRDGLGAECAFRLLLLFYKLHVWPPQGRRLKRAGSG
jgi:glycosyltransferase involved in cell wall biosynthesis